MKPNAKKYDTLGLGLMALAIPMFLETMLRSLLGTVNTFILSRYSDAAVAAVGVANQYMNLVIILFTVMSSGMGVLLSQHLGAGHRDEAGRVCCASLVINGTLGLAIGCAAQLFAREIVGWMSLEEELANGAAVYLRVMSLSILSQAVMSSMSVIFRNYGNARVPMYVMLITNAVNVLLSYVVVFLPGTFPWEGTSGVAHARVISELTGLIVLTALLMRSNRAFGIDFGGLRRIRLSLAGKILRLGCMTGVEGLCYNVAGLLTTAMVGEFGAQALSAKVYLNNVIYYVYIVGMAIGNATQIIVGRMVGAGRPDDAYRFAWRSWRWGLACNLGFSLLALALSERLYGMFTQDPVIIGLCCGIMRVDVLIEIGRSFNHNIKGALQGAGYMKMPMILAGSSIMLLNAGLGYILCTVAGLGLKGIWIAMACDELTRGLGNACFFVRGRWRASSLVG